VTRFLGVGETCDLGSLYMALLREGHEVRVAVSEPLAQGTMAGLVPRSEDWRADLAWLRDGGEPGIVLFESVSEGFGALQDELRREGHVVIGGSAFGDRLENDRAFAQRLLGELGLPPAPVAEFEDPSAAAAHIAARPRPYALKFSGPDYASSDNYVGVAPNGSDVAAVLAAKVAARGKAATRFILQDRIEGVEMGVGAYFDGERFLRPACLDWEHKRFFAGDLGELTGEMGTVATYDCTDRFFERTLALVEPALRAAGHVGYVNLNTIVNEAGIWPLEFTCRFGYPGYAILESLQMTPWGELFRCMATRQGGRFEAVPGFSVCVVLTTPPFPYSREEVVEAVGLPVFVDGLEAPGEREHFHFGEMGRAPDGGLVTSGLYGWTMVVTGTGATIAAAKAAAYARAARVRTPNLRYRLDIGDKLLAGDFRRVVELGMIG
jgi:phosphoribosylamine--glycine ligase